MPTFRLSRLNEYRWLALWSIHSYFRTGPDRADLRHVLALHKLHSRPSMSIIGQCKNSVICVGSICPLNHTFSHEPSPVITHLYIHTCMHGRQFVINLWLGLIRWGVGSGGSGGSGSGKWSLVRNPQQRPRHAQLSINKPRTSLITLGSFVFLRWLYRCCGSAGYFDCGVQGTPDGLALSRALRPQRSSSLHRRYPKKLQRNNRD